MRIRAQLRLVLGNRRKIITGNRNSVEKGTHRRKAPAHMRVCFAGAGESAESVPPTRFCSSEDSLRICAQLRLTFACRRKTNTEEPNSGERPVPRRKAPAPMRVCFAGADARAKFVPPTRACSSEDRLRPCAQLRPTFANRRRADYRHRTSCQAMGTGGCHLQAAVSPAKVCVVGGHRKNKRANNEGMQILQVTMQFRRREKLWHIRNAKSRGCSAFTKR